MMDETVTSCLRPLLEGLTFTIAGHPEHLPHCASAYEGDLIKEFGSEIGLGRANTKQKRDSSGTEATRRHNNKRNNRSRGRGRGWSNLRVLRALEPFHEHRRSVLFYGRQSRIFHILRGARADDRKVYDYNFWTKVERDVSNNIVCQSKRIWGRLADGLLHGNNIVREHLAKEKTKTVPDVVMAVCEDSTIGGAVCCM